TFGIDPGPDGRAGTELRLADGRTDHRGGEVSRTAGDLGLRGRELLLDVRNASGRTQQRRRVHQHLVLAQRWRRHPAPLRKETRREGRGEHCRRARLLETGRGMPRSLLRRADDGRQRSLSREPDDRKGRPDPRRIEIAIAVGQGPPYYGRRMAVGPAPLEHQVVYTPLHFDNPSSLDNYVKTGGYEAWKKILAEKPDPA